ncbi:hypothetical protein PR048_017361 [Dryococelus australis]|uniref:Transposase n=1 Tax=Dryococelus australis TaxID=614101 RepID=A0ABQ9H9A3_9NEOP|nr:hypothetical protein PR048_017361 [Dryococelus australis]
MDKIVGIVTDNAANMKCALSQLGTTSVSCLVHVLQLVVNSGCLKQQSVANVTSTSRRIVGHFHHSVLAKKCLTKAQQDLQIPEHCLIQDEPTTWDSTYLNLERLCEQRPAQTLAFQSLQLPSGVELSNQDWELAKVLVKTLKLLWEAIKALRGENSTIAVVNSIQVALNVCVGRREWKCLPKNCLQKLHISFLI